MTSPDADLVAEKITSMLAQYGDSPECRFFNKPPGEWVSIFNEAGQKLGFPVVAVGSLPEAKDVFEFLGRIEKAFAQAANGPVLVVIDHTGGHNDSRGFARYIHSYTQSFPKAIYMQIHTKETPQPQPSINFYPPRSL